jgi:DNA mismatch repair protein MutS2
VVREVRNSGRLLVEVKGRAFLTTEDQVTAAPEEKKRKPAARSSPPVYESSSETSLSLDLHGLTVDEAHEAVIVFIDRALLAGATEVRIIHGRSGGRLKSALHMDLKKITSVRSYAIDPRNAGVTIVKL